MLLRARFWSFGARSSQSTEQSIDDGADPEQRSDGGQSCYLRGSRDAVQIGPDGRDQASGTVGQRDEHLQLPVSMLPSQHLQRLSLKRVARPEHGYPLGVAVEVVVGSVSCLPSTPSITDGW